MECVPGGRGRGRAPARWHCCPSFRRAASRAPAAPREPCCLSAPLVAPPAVSRGASGATLRSRGLAGCVPCSPLPLLWLRTAGASRRGRAAGGVGLRWFAAGLLGALQLVCCCCLRAGLRAGHGMDCCCGLGPSSHRSARSASSDFVAVVALACQGRSVRGAQEACCHRELVAAASCHRCAHRATTISPHQCLQVHSVACATSGLRCQRPSELVPRTAPWHLQPIKSPRPARQFGKGK